MNDFYKQKKKNLNIKSKCICSNFVRMHKYLFIYLRYNIYIYNLIVGRGGIRTMNVSIKNTKIWQPIEL